jgi:hypothetical protein
VKRKKKMKEIQFKSIGNRKFEIGNSLSVYPVIRSKEIPVHPVQNLLFPGGLRRRAVARRWLTVARRWHKMARRWLTVAHRGTRKTPQNRTEDIKNAETSTFTLFPQRPYKQSLHGFFPLVPVRAGRYNAAFLRNRISGAGMTKPCCCR